MASSCFLFFNYVQFVDIFRFFKWLFAVKSFSSVLRTENSMRHFSRRCWRFSKPFFSRQAAAAATCSTREYTWSLKISDMTGIPYFPVWHFLNKVSVSVPVLNRYDLIISSMMRQSSCNCAVPYSRPTHRHSHSDRHCLLSFDSLSINPFMLTC